MTVSLLDLCRLESFKMSRIENEILDEVEIEKSTVNAL